MRAFIRLSWSIPFLGVIALTGFLILPSARAANSAEAPWQLRCEYLKNPRGIDVTQPRFQWVLPDSRRGEMQTAYQVLVASSLADLARDRGDVWDSGKVSSSDSTQVVYSGKPLVSGHTYYWKVRYWDSQGNASAYSQPASFEMGLLSRSEWKGQWIGGDGLLRKE